MKMASASPPLSVAPKIEAGARAIGTASVARMGATLLFSAELVPYLALALRVRQHVVRLADFLKGVRRCWSVTSGCSS
jgi:hypothetical protein